MDPNFVMTFIGVDLAWSPRNLSGVAVIQGGIQGGTVIHQECLSTNQEILSYIQDHAQDNPAIVAIDAPLTVPNQTGSRPGEKELAQVFRSYHAGAHPSNRQRLTFDGEIRGESLVTHLQKKGFIHAPMIEAQNPVRQVIEVFPHSAMVSIFHLNRILKYKQKPKRSLEERWQAWAAYHKHLLSLHTQDPYLTDQELFLVPDIIHLKNLTQKALKAYEDQIDALFCAYIALYGFRWGKDRCQTFGSLEEGYIFTPVPDRFWLT